MTSVIEIDAVEQQLPAVVDRLSIQDQGEMQNKAGNHGGVCAICMDEIELEEIALVKDHLCVFPFWLLGDVDQIATTFYIITILILDAIGSAYDVICLWKSVMCILRWVTYSKNPTCPQCKHPFEFLNVHRSLDGCINDYMFEESVCLLLRAAWFKPLVVEDRRYSYNEHEEFFPYEYYEDEDLDDDLDDEVYFSSSSSVRIGNRRWGDNGYVRGGRQEARPVHRANIHDSGAGSSREPRDKEVVKDKTGRRAKRALKREAADKAAAVKHQQHLARMGRK